MAIYDLRPTKVCSKCGVEKPAQRPHFGFHAVRGIVHISASCRPCINKARRKPRPAQKCRDCQADFRPTNNFQRLCGGCRTVNVRAIKARSNRRYAERGREACKRWIAANPERARRLFADNNRRRRARERGAAGCHSAAQFLALCEKLEWRCTYCGVVVPKDAITEDHMTPLTRGGSDFIENITSACRSCNSSKGTQTYEEFLARRSKAA